MARSPTAQTAPHPGAPGLSGLVKQDEATYEEVKMGRSPSAQIAPPPRPPVKAPPIPLPYRLAAVCLGFLCPVLVIVVIALFFSYNGELKGQDQLRMNYSNLTAPKDKLQEDIRNLTGANERLLKDFRNLTAAHDKLQVDYRNLSAGYSNLIVVKEELQKDTRKLWSVITELRRHFPVDQYCSITDQKTLVKECRPCPWGWELFSHKCYYFSTDKLNWNDSRTACRKQGADLVAIDSRGEQEFVTKHMKRREYWMGLSDAAGKGTWIWVDGTQPIEWYWIQNQPGNFQNNTACLASADKAIGLKNWNDQDCSKKKSRICEGSSLPLSP
nr:PREDICTED: CD209 antigen-like protein B isoform X2 [Lepisosteus oculatus]